MRKLSRHRGVECEKLSRRLQEFGKKLLSVQRVKYSAFVTGEQHLEFLRLPFGLSGVCSTISRLFSNCLENCREYMAGYFEDILVHSDD